MRTSFTLGPLLLCGLLSSHGALAESLGQDLDEASIPADYLAKPVAARPLDADVYAAHYGARADHGGSLLGGCSGREETFRMGAARFDISGPAFDQEQAGYADGEQISEGLHNRQWARAFVLESPCNGSRVALVSLDMGLMFHAVRQGVIELVEADAALAGRYTWDNLLLTPTHSHMTAAGQAHHDLYNFFAYGHDTQSYEAAVAGVFQALKLAHERARAGEPGHVLFAQAELLNATVQRSAPAYLQNPGAERDHWRDVDGNPVTINRNSVVLGLRRLDPASAGAGDDSTVYGDAVGMVNWFPIHGTSMGQYIRLLSGDNKGYAAWRFEQDYDVDPLALAEDFVAGFFQADEGDNSPNIHINTLSAAEIQARDPDNPNWVRRGGGDNDYQSTLISGTRQYLRARELFDGADRILTGGVHYAHAFIDFYRVDLEHGQQDRYPEALRTGFSRQPGGETVFGTCEPAYGISFAGGAEDGRGPSSEGQTCAAMDDPGMESWQELVASGMGAGEQGALPPGLIVPVGCNNPAYDALGYACHAEKPIAIPLHVSPFDPTQSLAPRTMALQLITIGNLVVIGMPFEVTTMSGRRIRDAVLARLAPHGIDYAVVSGLSNMYGHYLTTREEYGSQQYEGASTIFGPWQQEVVVQELEKLAAQLIDPAAAASAYAHAAGVYRTHRTSYLHQANTSNGVHPAPPIGAVVAQPEASYAEGDLVEARFVALNPRNDNNRQADTFLFVERKLGASGNWKRVRSDNDWSTRIKYLPDRDDGTMHAQITWVVPPGMKNRSYRITYRWRDQSASTEPFEVR